jgi:hypothetical protein
MHTVAAAGIGYHTGVLLQALARRDNLNVLAVAPLQKITQCASFDIRNVRRVCIHREASITRTYSTPGSPIMAIAI